MVPSSTQIFSFLIFILVVWEQWLFMFDWFTPKKSRFVIDLFDIKVVHQRFEIRLYLGNSLKNMVILWLLLMKNEQICTNVTYCYADDCVSVAAVGNCTCVQYTSVSIVYSVHNTITKPWNQSVSAKSFPYFLY